MGRKRGAKARQKEAERRRQLQQHGVTVLGSKGRPLSKKSGNAKRKLKNTQAFLDRQLEGTNPFATKRGSGASIRVRQKTLLHDYKSRKRSTVFADKRLGEYDMVRSVNWLRREKRGNAARRRQIAVCVCVCV